MEKVELSVIRKTPFRRKLLDLSES